MVSSLRSRGVTANRSISKPLKSTSGSIPQACRIVEAAASLTAAARRPLHQSTKERSRQINAGPAPLRWKVATAGAACARRYAPADQGREGLVEVHDVGSKGRDRAASLVATRAATASAARELPFGGILRTRPNQRRGGRVVGRGVVSVGGDEEDVVAPAREFATHRERLFLHATEDAERVGRHDGDARQALSKRGCKTCHCSGARRMRPSSSNAMAG